MAYVEKSIYKDNIENRYIDYFSQLYTNLLKKYQYY